MQATLASHTALPALSQYIQKNSSGSCSQATALNSQRVSGAVRSRLIRPISSGTPSNAVNTRRAVSSYGCFSQRPQT